MLPFSSDTGAAVMRRAPRPERERPTGTSTPNLWAPSGPTAALLRGLSDRLGLGWSLNGASRPDLLVLTNLGRGDPARLIARCRPRRTVLCLDDKAGRAALARTALPCFTYSEGRDEADLTARDLRSRPDGLAFLAVTRRELTRVTVPPDDLYAALAALACSAALGVPLSAAGQALSALLCAAGKTPSGSQKTL